MAEQTVKLTKATKKNFDTQGVDDLVMLPKVTEEAIIENLKKRYHNDLIYTNIGPVLISVNPFRNLGNGGDAWINTYKNKFRHELPPHIYALAEETYRAMKGELENQCVIISGESGAGKTECAKMIMQYVAAVSGTGSGAIEYIKSVILDSNPLLEAFGNAKTLRNNNSSRFGKYFEIKFDTHGEPCGGRITNYLLEKSRVVNPGLNERNFHIFYQLINGASEQEAQDFQLFQEDNFNYLRVSNCVQVAGIDDVQWWSETRHAMQTVGISQASQAAVFQLVAAVLHIGNIGFSEDDKGNAVVFDSRMLDLACSMLQVESFVMSSAILFRVVNTGAASRGSTYNVPQNVEQASFARDALAKSIYSRLFDWLIAQVNAALEKHALTSGAVIGVLDIFGFEIFDNNGFEQFCINFVNEKLQQYFIELTLKAEQEEYNQEGIQWTPIKYFNNKVVCDLIESKRPPGIFSILDDVVYTMHATAGGANDQKFLGKLGAVASHLHYQGWTHGFTIKHYAGDVSYNVEGFCDKNKDSLFQDLVEGMQSSSLPFLVSLFPENTGAAQKKRPTTAGFKIKNSCGELMKALSACSPHYVRCIKPNENKAAQDWDAQRCKHQVQYLGLYENVRVRRAGFAYRATFERFLRRYKKLSPTTWGMWGEWTGDNRQGCQELLRGINVPESQWQFGKTKIFIRHPETLFHLEELLERFDYDCTVRIQNAWKRWKMRKHALEQRALAADLLRGKKERQRDSVGRQFFADYMAYARNFGIQAVINDGETMVFADQVVKLNRRSRPERRDLVITDRAVYLVMRKKRGAEVFYKVTRRTSLDSIRQVSLSTLADNYIVLHTPNEYDNLFENEKKSEVLSVVNEYYEKLTGQKMQVTFSDSISYKIRTGDTRTINFQKGGAAKLQKSGKTLTVIVPDGLPKDTDSTPKGFRERGAGARSGGGASRARGGAARGAASAAAGARGGAGAARGGPAAGAARGGAGPARGGAGPPRGGAGAARGGAARGAMARGGGPPRGGMARGGGPPRGGMARGGGPPRGGGGRGGPPRGGAGGRGGPPRGRGGPPRGRGGAGAGGPPARPQAKALFPFTASKPDELTFNEGDIIVIVQADAGGDAGGWFEGELNGVRGWCPSNYVEKI